MIKASLLTATVALAYAAFVIPVWNDYRTVNQETLAAAAYKERARREVMSTPPALDAGLPVPGRKPRCVPLGIDMGTISPWTPASDTRANMGN